MTDRTYYFAAISIIILVIGSVAWTSRVADQTPLVVDATEKQLGNLAPAQVVKVPFRFHNGSSRLLRILGSTMDCTRDGCIGPESLEIFPITIPPGKDGVLDYTFKAGDPGPISHPMTVFTDCEQSPKFLLKVVGQVVAPLGDGGL